ncbi:hypothetical protein [uncultured Bacteroides sp.]|uniref:hypothetical protein n=1 Tax=uncultured Bacteroides sp. TaxID=162156 RepID=UPI00280BBB1B|nr:hypothetical protein [uncultured Bacteroides sp.]
MSKFIELPVFPSGLKDAEYAYMPVNIEQIAYVMPSSKNRCKLYFSANEYIDVDIDIEEMKVIVKCTEQIKSANDMD